jgi:cysteine desulfurase
MYGMKTTYLDYASLTPIDRRVMREIKKYSAKEYGNPSALYASGVAAKRAIADAKKRIADILHAHPDEIIFTSGGTESNELVFRQFKNIVTSAIEHSSIKRNKAVAVKVEKNGIVDLEDLKNKITAETELVSIMYVNNEIGVIEPISEIVKCVKKINKKILVHTDASQAMYLPQNVEKLGVDMMTLDGGKIYGPRGIGMLYIKRGTVKIERHGTENVPAIMGFALALEIAEKTREKESARLRELKNFFMSESKLKVNGEPSLSSPHIINVSIPGIDNEFFVLKLDAQGFECSTKSACLIDEDESYVMKAIGGDSATSVRFSFGRDTAKRDIQKLLKVIAEIQRSTYN